MFIWINNAARLVCSAVVSRVDGLWGNTTARPVGGNLAFATSGHCFTLTISADWVLKLLRARFKSFRGGERAENGVYIESTILKLYIPTLTLSALCFSAFVKFSIQTPLIDRRAGLPDPIRGVGGCPDWSVISLEWSKIGSYRGRCIELATDYLLTQFSH